MRIRERSWLRTSVVVVLAGLMIALTIANYRFALVAPGGNDFLGRWNAAHYWLVHGVNPYDPEVSQATQRLIYGRLADTQQGEETGDFIYPLPAMLFFAPFGLLPYTIARALWMTLLELCLPALALMGVRLARWKPSGRMLLGLMLFSVVWYPGLRAAVVGQFAVVEAVLMVAALVALQGRQDVLAGILLGLSLSKPQMVMLLLPFVLVWSVSVRRRTILTSTLLTTAALVGASLALIPDWPLLWARQLTAYTGYAYLGSPIEILSLRLPAASLWVNRILTAVVLLMLAGESYRALGKGERTFNWTAQMAIVVTNLVAFRTATANYVVLLPTLCLIFAVWEGRWRRRGALAAFVTLLLLLVGLWALFLITVVGNTESPVMYLPLPVLAFFGLLWVRWWATREIPSMGEEGART